MLGPISNASEFKDLCQILKKKIYLMNELLTIIHETDDFENGYIATGIIAQMVFDGCGLWNTEEIDKGRKISKISYHGFNSLKKQVNKKA